VIVVSFARDSGLVIAVRMDSLSRNMHAELFVCASSYENICKKTNE